MIGTSTVTAGRATMRGTVLIVDDVPTIRESLRLALQGAGFDVLTAGGGREALEVAERVAVDAVVSDLCMPEVDGVEVLTRIRERDGETPVILMTASPDLDSAIRAVELGALRYLIKPVDPEQLVAVVEEATRLRRLAALNREAHALFRETAGHRADRAALEQRFERALRGLWLAYQPIVRWSDRRIFGWEALLRSHDPDLSQALGLVRSAETLGRVHDLGRAARALAAEGAAALLPGTHLFVNLHPHDLDDLELYDPASPLASVASRVVLEITERASLDELADLEERVTALRGLGFRIALDDLGAGYASLNTFAKLKPDIVKIDMEIVQGADVNPTRARLIESLAQLCDEMKVRLIGEGVETAAERDKVAELGCDLLQGFFFARPARSFPSVDPVLLRTPAHAVVG